MTGETRKRTFGLAAILVVGTIAGFLAAAGTGGANYATVGTISDSQAFQMPAEEDQRVRFMLQADQATAQEPVASFALYDPSDSFFTEIDLQGDGDDAEAILDEEGPWVLFVTERRNADLAIQYDAEDDEAADVELSEVPVTEESTVVAEQDGGALDEQVALRLDHRPASVLLTYDGDIENLDATVSTDEGPAYELTDAQANASGDATRSGDVAVTSANLEAGTFEIEATADAFDGKLSFVQQSYERQQTQVEEDEVEKEIEPYTEQNQGSIVAELDEHEAYEVDTGASDEIAFIAPQDSRAELAIYDDEDRFVDAIELEADHEYHSGWDHDEDEEARETNETVAVADVPEAGSYVVYAKYVYPDDAALTVFVPNATSAQADQLEVEVQEVELEGNDTEWNTTLDGALVELSAYTRDVAGMERNVTVTGEEGPVLHYEQHVNTFGVAVYEEHSVHTERFTDGDLDVTVEGDGVGASTHLELANYIR